jgi:O-antigen/teichoic acid export membrane protein
VAGVSQRLIRGGLVAVGGRSGVALGTILLNALLARLLAPAEVGQFLLALSLVTVAAVLADFGFGKTLLRMIPQAMAAGQTHDAVRRIRQVLAGGLLTGLVAAGVLASWPGAWLAVKLSQGSELSLLMPLVATWLVITLLLNLLAETFRGFHDIGFAILVGGAVTGLGNIVIMSLVLSWFLFAGIDVNLRQVLLLFIASSVLLACCAAVLLWNRLRDWQSGGQGRLREVFAMAWPFWIANTAIILQTQLEIWLLGWLRTPEEVATFGLIARLALVVSFPLLIINSVLPPLISELYSTADMSRLQRMLRASAGLTTLAATILFVLLLVAGDSLTVWLYGEYFAGNWHILMILSAGLLFHVWAGSGGFVLSMTDNQHVMMLITLVSSGVTLLLGIILTRQYGALGMAVASTTGLVLLNSLMLLFIRRRLGILIHASVAGVKDVYREVLRRMRSKDAARSGG